jgi:hypothetical protein
MDKELTTDDLWNLLRLAEDYADRCDEDDAVEETAETYNALAAKIYAVIKKMEGA